MYRLPTSRLNMIAFVEFEHFNNAYTYSYVYIYTYTCTYLYVFDVSYVRATGASYTTRNIESGARLETEASALIVGAPWHTPFVVIQRGITMPIRFRR